MPDDEVKKLSPNARKIRDLDIRDKAHLASKVGVTVGYLNRFARGEFRPAFRLGDEKCLANRMKRAGYPLEDWEVGK